LVKIPDKLLLRRSEVIECLGVDRRALTKMVSAGLLERIYVGDGTKKTRAYYRRADVVKLAGCEVSE